MAVRTNEADVLAVLDPDTGLTSGEITPFIADANAFVNAHLLSKGLSDDLLTRIEKYVAADFAVGRRPLASRARHGDREETFTRSAATKALDSPYGETAKALDTSGTLASLGNEQRRGITFRVGGR